MNKKTVINITLLSILAMTLIPTGILQISTVNAATAYSGSEAYFGNNAVGTITNNIGLDRDAGRYQLTTAGNVQSISVYFATSGFSAKAAIYTDTNNSPNNLVIQSSSDTITETGWHTFTVPTTSLIPAYYWLSVVCDSRSAKGAMSSVATNQHAYKTTTYSNEFPSSFGTQTGY